MKLFCNAILYYINHNFKPLNSNDKKTSLIKHRENMKTLKVRNHISRTLPAMALIAFVSSCAAKESIEPNTSDSQELATASESESTGVSTDGFGQTDSENNAVKGDGTGDLVLVIYDPGGKSPRKKSLLLDLSVEEKNGKINDLNLSDISKVRKQITISNDEVSKFIESSKSPDKILWQVFAIANHYEVGEEFGDTDLINYGLATTEIKKPKAPMAHQEIHQSKIHRANLILENNIYDISANASLISFTGEPSAFDTRLHSMLANGTQTTGNLEQKLEFGIHKLHLNDDKKSGFNKFSTSYNYLGNFKLEQSKPGKAWQLIFSSK